MSGLTDSDLLDMDAEESLMWHETQGGALVDGARAKRIRTRPGLARRFVRWIRCAWMRYEIRSAEQWFEQCARDGILQSRSLDECRHHVQAMRVRLALLEAS